jgi:hypothetical protein
MSITGGVVPHSDTHAQSQLRVDPVGAVDAEGVGMNFPDRVGEPGMPQLPSRDRAAAPVVIAGLGYPEDPAGVDQVLAAPEVDALLADVQIGGDLRHPTPGRDQVQDLATKLRRVTWA